MSRVPAPLAKTANRFVSAVGVVLSIATLSSATLVHAQAGNCSVIDNKVVCTTQAEQYGGLDKAEKGTAIYADIDQQHGPSFGYGSPGYGNSQSSFTAVIREANGQERTRSVRLKYWENAPDGHKRLAIFEAPKDLKRTAFLTLSYKEAEDEQWFYDPKSKQVQRIQSNNAFTPFAGMDINFEDISSQDLNKYGYEYLGEEFLNGQNVYVINRFPKDPNSGYSRLETWVEKDSFKVLKVNFFDKNNKALKTMEFNDYKLFDERYWRATSMQVTNLKNGRITQLQWGDFKFNTNVNKNDFEPANLRYVN